MLAIVGRAGRRPCPRTTTVRVPPRQRDRSIVADLRLGFDTVVRSPLMRLVAIAYVLLAILGFSVTYPLLLAASETFSTEADLATALGVLSAAVTATSFVVSVALANRVYARFGVTGAALLLPIVYLGGFGLWLVAFSFSTAALFRFTQQVTQRGISNSAWSAFYNVVPRERRAQVLAFNDGVPGPGRDDPVGIPPAGRGHAPGPRPGVLARRDHRPRLHGRRGRHQATLSRERRRQPADRPGRAGPRRRAGQRRACPRPGRQRHAHRRARGTRARDPADGRWPARPRARSSGQGRR